MPYYFEETKSSHLVLCGWEKKLRDSPIKKLKRKCFVYWETFCHNENILPKVINVHASMTFEGLKVMKPGLHGAFMRKHFIRDTIFYKRYLN